MPITVITGDKCSRDGSTGSEVDGRVEPHVDTLVSDSRIPNDNFARLESLLAKLASILFGDHRGYIGLDRART